MADFTPINTQEELDRVLADRLAREREKAVRPYADYEQIKTDLGTARQTLAERDAKITDLNDQLKSARSDLAKTRIALDKGLPLALAERLRGETEDEMKSDADNLAKLFTSRAAEPGRSTEKEKAKSTGGQQTGIPEDALREVLNQITL